jgi:hypothetical protein
MDLLKKNVMWIALIGAVLGVWAIYELKFKKETPDDPFTNLTKAQFTGKLPIDNPNLK